MNATAAITGSYLFCLPGAGRGLRRSVTWADGTADPQQVDMAISIPRFKRTKVSEVNLTISWYDHYHVW